VDGEGVGQVAAPLSATTLPPGEQRSAGFTPALNIAAWVVFAGAVAAGVLFVRRYAVNTVYWDQFSDLNLIKHAHAGTLSFSLLWAQHNENRVFFPNLITLALAYTTHLNIVFEQYLSLVFWCGALVLIVAAHKRRSPGLSWIYYGPAVLVFLSFTPISATLFGYRMSWFLALLALGAAIFLLDRTILSRAALIGAVIAAFVGSFSAFEGLFIWPAGLALLLLRRRGRTALTVWIVSAAVTGALFVFHYNFSVTSGDSGYVLHHPWVAVSFFFSSIGNVVSTDYPSAVNAVDYRILVLGIIVFVIAIWGLIHGIRGDQSGAGPIGVALICFGLLFVAFITPGRTHFGLHDTGARYSIFEITIWIGAYLALLGSPLPQFTRLASWWRNDPDRPSGSLLHPASWERAITVAALIGLVGLMAIQVVSGDKSSVPDARAWRGNEILDAQVMVNIKKAPDGLLATALGPYSASFERHLTAFARSQHLSLFDTNVVAAYAKEGLPAAPTPVTAVLAPKSGATLKGGLYLVAAASDSYGITKVVFRLTGGTLHGAVIATAAPETFGWFGGWNTTTVPNGTYRLQSVATDGAGGTAQSASITVTVANGRSRS
jgi:hypothetical protein